LRLHRRTRLLQTSTHHHQPSRHPVPGRIRPFLALRRDLRPTPRILGRPICKTITMTLRIICRIARLALRLRLRT
jgi:hypothetical protein